LAIGFCSVALPHHNPETEKLTTQFIEWVQPSPVLHRIHSEYIPTKVGFTQGFTEHPSAKADG